MLAPVKKWLLSLWLHYERPIRIGMLVSGFAFDYIIAKRPDSPFVNILLLSYLGISAVCISMLSRRSLRIAEVRTEPILLLLILQFCFGGLASNMFILYGKSGTPAGDLIFLGLLGALLIGNEFLKNRYQELRFNIAIYYLLLLTYCVIAVPTFILHSIGPVAFLISGGISLLAMIVFLSFLAGTARVFRGEAGYRRRIETRFTVIGILAFFIFLYFANIIPPVPLALKDIGVYHAIVPIAGATSDTSRYQAAYEATPWWEFWQNTSGTFHVNLGKTAYCYSAVFAPENLTTPVYHRWEHYDDAAGQWTTASRTGFSVSGGRGEGYRAFSTKTITEAGEWRCDVETPDGRLIGRAQFTAATTSADLPVSERAL